MKKADQFLQDIGEAGFSSMSDEQLAAEAIGMKGQLDAMTKKGNFAKLFKLASKMKELGAEMKKRGMK